MIRLNVRYSGLGEIPGGAVNRVRRRFQDEAGTMILDAIRSLLGFPPPNLSPDYKKRKPNIQGFRRMAGRPPSQPLILTGEMFDALTVIPDGDGFRVQVDDSKAVSDRGFDYGEYWESNVHYLERGLDLVEDKLDELLAQIIQDELML